jgi:cell division protein FtsL
MKIKFNNFVAFALLILVFGCASSVFAQKSQIAGKSSKVSVKDKNLIKAANFAIRERAKSQNTEVNLLEIKNAKMTLAAGRHYEICMLTNYRNKRSNQLVDQFVRVIVYRNLKNKYQLTSWTQENCTEVQKSE